MTVSRRRILVASAATAAAALTGRFARRSAAYIAAKPWTDPVVRDRDTLILHDGGTAALAFAEAVRASTDFRRLSECTASMLTMAGFTEVGARLDRTRGGVLLSLLDDADTVVVEALLKTRNAERFTRQRQGRQVLLFARLPQ